MNDKLKLIGSIFGLIAVIISGYMFLEGKMNKVAEATVNPISKAVQELDKRLTLTELKELYRKALEDYYYWKDLSKKYPNDDEIKDSLEKAKKRVKEIEDRIKELETKR